MFGTNRTITEFSLRIFKVNDDSEEQCSVWGGVSYTSEIDFHNETHPDTIEIHLALTNANFNKLAKIISNKSVDVIRVGISRVSGFYSNWSPLSTTNCVKVLTCESEQEVIRPDGCDVFIPRLGEVGKFELSLITRCKLDPKQNFKTLDISKLFESELEFNEEENECEIEEQETEPKLIMAQIAHNQAEIIRMKKPIWLIVILLGMILLSNGF